jgi:hypothetical protein
MPEKPDAMKLEEVAERLATTVANVRKATRTGQLPGMKIGGKWVVFRRPFERLMEGEIEPAKR